MKKEKITKAVAVVENSTETLISQAITQNVPVETLERLFTLREKVKAESAREAFIGAMAKFQSECPVIVKTKEVYTKSGGKAYAYAPIESIVSQVKDALASNGFSYSTNMEMSGTGVKVTIKVQHILGHSEVTEMSVPLGSKTAVMSDSQVVAAASTFAKRYAFLNAFGILTGDEDVDGADVKREEVAPVSDEMMFGAQERLEACTTIEELKRVWSDIPASMKTALGATKEKMKSKLAETVDVTVTPV